MNRNKDGSACDCLPDGNVKKYLKKKTRKEYEV